MSYPISRLDGIDADTAKALKTAGIRTTEKLLEAAKDTKGRKALAARTGLSEKRLLKWANSADRITSAVRGRGGSVGNGAGSGTFAATRGTREPAAAHRQEVEPIARNANLANRPGRIPDSDEIG